MTETIQDSLPVPSELLAAAIEHLEEPCCYGYAFFGPERCTCWVSDYAPARTSPDTASTPEVMPSMCGDCAFRRGSPERRGEAHVAANWEDLQRLVATETPFWCHDGMPKVSAWRHLPTGITVPAPPSVDSYAPTIVDAVPYRADGRAGAQCAGWAYAVARQAARDAGDLPTFPPLAALLARRPELRGVGISDALESRWTA